MARAAPDVVLGPAPRLRCRRPPLPRLPRQRHASVPEGSHAAARQATRTLLLRAGPRAPLMQSRKVSTRGRGKLGKIPVSSNREQRAHAGPSPVQRTRCHRSSSRALTRSVWVCGPTPATARKGIRRGHGEATFFSAKKKEPPSSALHERGVRLGARNRSRRPQPAPAPHVRSPRYVPSRRPPRLGACRLTLTQANSPSHCCILCESTPALTVW